MSQSFYMVRPTTSSLFLTIGFLVWTMLWSSCHWRQKGKLCSHQKIRTLCTCLLCLLSCYAIYKTLHSASMIFNIKRVSVTEVVPSTRNHFGYNGGLQAFQGLDDRLPGLHWPCLLCRASAVRSDRRRCGAINFEGSREDSTEYHRVAASNQGPPEISPAAMSARGPTAHPTVISVGARSEPRDPQSDAKFDASDHRHDPQSVTLSDASVGLCYAQFDASADA